MEAKEVQRKNDMKMEVSGILSFRSCILLMLSGEQRLCWDTAPRGR